MENAILAILTHECSAASALAAAETAARVEQADRIEALHVSVDPLTTIVAPDEILSDERRNQIETRNTENAAALKTLFDSWSAGRDAGAPPAAWREVFGDVRKEVADAGKSAKLVVLGKLDAPPEPFDLACYRQALHAAIFDTGRPFLLTPSVTRLPPDGRVVIAWKESQAASRAVLAALPWLARAKSIWIVVVGEHGHGGDARGCVALLVEHGLKYEVLAAEAEEQNIGDHILAAASQLGADLLVMGAYRRNRLLEWVLGGATARVLEATATPILMRH